MQRLALVTITALLVAAPAFAGGSWGYNPPTLTWPTAPEQPTQTCTQTAPVSSETAFPCPPSN